MSDQSIICIHADKSLQLFIKEALVGSPVKSIRTCTVIKEAYDFYAKEQSPIVVIDTFVPGSTGLDLVKAVRKMNENVAIILLGRIRTRAFIERAFRTGASDVLPYPTEKDIFLNTILHRLRNVSEQEVHFT